VRDFSKSNSMTKSFLASPVRSARNSARSLFVARSALRKREKGAGFRPAPLRLPPWVDFFMLFRLEIYKRLCSVFPTFVRSVHSGGFVANVLESPAVDPIQGVHHLHDFANFDTVHNNPVPLTASTMKIFKFNFHDFIIPFCLNMITVYQIQEKMSRVNNKLVYCNSVAGVH
jgi:hypothetical protein